MADVAQLGVHIETTGADQAISALNRVEGATKSTHQSTLAMGAAMGAVSAVVTQAFGAMTSAAGAVAGAAGGLVDMNSKLEQSSIAFTTMLGSAEKAGAFLEDMKQFAATTPFEFPELIQASKRMLAFGFSAQQIRPMLTSIGDAAAGLSIGAAGIDRITTALGQMQMKGKVSAEEVNQLAEAGINAWDAVAKKLGIDVPTAMKQAEQGMISSAVAIPAILEGMTAKFGGMMEAQSHTFAGAMSTIKDTLGQLAGGAFKAFFDTLSGLADRLAQFAQTETVSVWAQDLQIKLGALAPLFAQLGAWLEARLPAAMSAAEAGAHGFVAAMQDLGPKLADLAQNAGPVLAEAWGKLGTAATAVGTAFATIGPPLATVYGAFSQVLDLVNGALGQALGALAGEFENVGRAMAPVGEALTRFVQETDASGLNTLQSSIAALSDGFNALGPILSTVAESFRIALVEGINLVLPKLEELRGWLGETLPPALAILQESWDGFWSHAGPLVTAMWDAVQPILGAAIGIELAILQKALETFKGVWDFVWGGILAAIEKVAPLIGALASTFGGAFAGLSDTITAALADMKTPVAEAATEVGTTITNNIVQGVAPVGAAVEAAVAPAAAAITTVGTSATTAAPAVTGLGMAMGTTGTQAGKAATELLTAADAEKKLADAATTAANAVTLARAKGQTAFTEEAGSANANALLQALTAGQGVEAAGWAKYMTAIGEAETASFQWAKMAGLDAELVRRAIDGDTDAVKRLTDEIKRAQDAAAKGIQLSTNIGVAGVSASGSGFGVLSAGTAWEAMERRIIEGAPSTGERVGQALGQGVQAGVTAAAPAISAAVTNALSAGAVNPRTAPVGGRMSQGTARNPEIEGYLSRHPEMSGTDVLAPGQYAALIQQFAGASDEIFSAALNAAVDRRISEFAQAETARNAPPKEGQASAQAAAAQMAAALELLRTGVIAAAADINSMAFQAQATRGMFQANIAAGQDWETATQGVADGLARLQEGFTAAVRVFNYPDVSAAPGYLGMDPVFQAIAEDGTDMSDTLREVAVELQAASDQTEFFGAAVASASRATKAATLIAQAASEKQFAAATGQLQSNEAVAAAMQKAGHDADSLGQGLDFAGAAAARAGLAALDMTHNTVLAAAAAQAAAESFKAAAANAQALMAGSIRNAGVIGGVTEKGLTYTQIMSGQTPGSSTGITTMGSGGPGNYYGLPVISGSPITPGTLRGYADGGMVYEPTYLTNARTGRTSGIMAENGPERIGGGGSVTANFTIYASGTNLLDERQAERVLDGALGKVLSKRGYRRGG